MSENPDTELEGPEPEGPELEAGPELGGVSELEAESGLEDGVELDDERLAAVLESLLLVVDTPASDEQLAEATATPVARVREQLERMAAELTARGSGIDLRYAGDGWRYYTRAEFAPYVEKLLQGGARSKLTRAALETLAVVAYRQPLTRARISAVRGVNVDGVVRTLLTRGLLAESGTDRESGATLYVTTELFLERLGLASLADLPDLAPMLPDVDVIDELTESVESDARFARMNKAPTSVAEIDTDLGDD
ncbi:SMC-Scp complex subunit ScpB [Rhodococcus rhodnii]|uniref:Chromosome segregation and condensation protein n=2 Tax=Rhodococcus rhodnii TaxID=38312 RepID=R7WT55_9NOCA|nr:SMC-Scp complex subunit ScpB [Rhodococcus rhodnii]EOM78465.1 chromosome segregation and condensation protein [Rhodococcus rhodnii LMG 5362]TXG91269.1 SMC-Scp complex subunit ScpB [Rhodococcus rhodnii]